MRGFCNIFMIMALMPMAVHATCEPGYYLAEDKCPRCPSGYYCPGDDTMIACPPITTEDWVAQLQSPEYEVYSAVGGDFIWSWNEYGGPAYSIFHCFTNMNATTSIGLAYAEPRYDGTQYKIPYPLWYEAASGYYLSGFGWHNTYDWYLVIKPCTNAPAHAHYTGAGTPDEPKSGGATDYNDCPWECDDGYGRHGDECVGLCTAGAQHIKTSGGMQFNLYPIAYSVPALVLEYNGGQCYGVLSTGAMSGAINIGYNGQIYHLEN